MGSEAQAETRFGERPEDSIKDRPASPESRRRTKLADLETEPQDTTQGWTRFEYIFRGLTYLVIFGIIALALSGLTGLKNASGFQLQQRIQVDRAIRSSYPTRNTHASYTKSDCER